MLFSLQKLFSILALVAPGLLSPVQQDPLQLTCTSNAGTISGYDLTQDVEYGYKGPGVYHITSLADHYNLVVGDTGTGEGVPVVMWGKNDTNTQRWYFSDVGGGFITAANNGTGMLLSGAASRAPAHANCTSPGKLETRWRMHNYSSSVMAGNPIRFTNAKHPNEILNVYKQYANINGSAVYIWPSWGQNLNEAWVLEYLGAL